MVFERLNRIVENQQCLSMYKDLRVENLLIVAWTMSRKWQTRLTRQASALT